MKAQKETFLIHHRGFTLIELLLVVTIIAILAAMVMPNFAGKSDEAKKAASKADIESNISIALDLYELDNGGYPSTDQGLMALIQKPATPPVPEGWNGSYLKKKRIPKDPWGNDYVYVSPGLHNSDSYDLSSYGPDKVESADDITNWENDTVIQTERVNQI